MIKNYFIFIVALIIFMQYGNSKLLHSASVHCISILLIAYFSGSFSLSSPCMLGPHRLGGWCVNVRDSGVLAAQPRELADVATIQRLDRRRRRRPINSCSQWRSSTSLLLVPSPRKTCHASPVASDGEPARRTPAGRLAVHRAGHQPARCVPAGRLAAAYVHAAE
jgi:hypothetical protein